MRLSTKGVGDGAGGVVRAGAGRLEYSSTSTASSELGKSGSALELPPLEETAAWVRRLDEKALELRLDK